MFQSQRTKPILKVIGGGLALFFCLHISSVLGFAAISTVRPSVATRYITTLYFSPATNSVKANNLVNFSAIFYQANGWQNIQLAQIIFKVPDSSLSVTLSYNQNTNKLYLSDNSCTGWVGGYAPGSANLIQNSYATIDCSKITAVGSASLLKMKANITFKCPFTATLAKGIYLKVIDDLNSTRGWIRKGSWLIESSSIFPQINSTTPKDSSTYYENSAVLVRAEVCAPDPAQVEYQFSAAGINRPWSKANLFIFKAPPGKTIIKIETRNPNGQDSKEIEIFGYRRPISPPAQ